MLKFASNIITAMKVAYNIKDKSELFTQPQVKNPENQHVYVPSSIQGVPEKRLPTF